MELPSIFDDVTKISEIKSIPSILLASDGPHRILSMSLSFEDMFGFNIQDLQRSLRCVMGPKTDSKGFQTFIRMCPTHERKEFVFYRKDGNEIPCSVQIYALEHNGTSAIRLEFDPSTAHRHRDDAELPPANAGPDIPASISTMPSERCFTAQHHGVSPEDVDPAVLIHMTAVQRAVQVAKRRQHRTYSQAL